MKDIQSHAPLAPGGPDHGVAAFPGCRDCLWGLARTAAQLGANHDPRVRADAEKAGLAALDASLQGNLSSPEAANIMLRAIKRVTGTPDPYLDIKRREMELARETLTRITPRLGPELLSLLSLAALGNSLDFFRPALDVLPEVEAAAGGNLAFYRNDAAKLKKFLARPRRTIIYLSDNSGEIFFDLPLFHWLETKAEKVVLTVKGGPALNDLTRDDLVRAGLDNEFKYIEDTGVDGAGVDWDNVSPAFRNLMAKADLIVSKGMANFETLYGRSLPTPVFYIFKVKCTPMRDFLKAPAESFWALWRDGTITAAG
ncbi:MAG: ARMT1-like domain-containing protein [Pseudomonadota bacterium]